MNPLFALGCWLWRGAKAIAGIPIGLSVRATTNSRRWKARQGCDSHPQRKTSPRKIQYRITT